jgi:predicted RNA-binding protein YlxR (DUF448 family)
MTAAMTTPHVPMRTCVACRTRRPQSELVRIVRGPEGAPVLDLEGGAPGRGAYLCEGDACRTLAERRGILRRALRLPVGGPSLLEVAHGA